MKTSDAIEHFSTGLRTGRRRLAEKLSEAGWTVTPEAISQWGEHPPLGRQYQIESLTNGALKATPKKEKSDDIQRPKAS